MAKLTISGIDELEHRLKAIDQGLRGEAEEKMLQAGADVLIRSWQNSIESKGHRVTGAMQASVGKTEIRHTEKGAEIYVYPMGTDNHRINNAQKAFIIHYGRKPTRRGTKEIKGDRFVTEAEHNAKAEIFAAMQAALNEYVSGKE